MKNSRVKIYIPRTLEKKIRKFLSSPEIIAILGARQVGKTTLMRKIYNELSEPKVFIDFEDQEALNLFDEDIKAFARLYVEGNKYVMIDEVQYSQKGGKHLKYLYDNYKTKFIISGSSSLDIALKAVSFLVGRVFLFELFPLNFEEFCSFKAPRILRLMGERVKKGEAFSLPFHEKLLGHFEEFALWGGYPRVVLSEEEEEKQEVLKNIYNTYLLKDLRGFFRLATESNIQKLIRALAFQVGNLIQYNELSRLAELSYGVLKKHLAILEETYILKLSKPFFTNKRIEIVKNPKIYFIDTGLRNYICQDFRALNNRPDSGALLENTVATEFIKRQLELMHWRTKSKGEVDFVLTGRSGVIPVEVKSGIVKNAGKAFLSFIEKYNPSRAYLLHTGTVLSKSNADLIDIQFMPAYTAGFLEL